MAIIALLNRKGGVGKSSCVHHLSGTFAAMGHKVLAVDNDPQRSLTQGFFGPVAANALDPSETIAALYRGEAPFPDQIIRPTPVAGVDIIPGSDAANDYNVPRPHLAPADQQDCLRAFLDEVRGRYDLILIDNPPTLDLASWAALVAADYLIVPASPEDYAAQGLADVLGFVERVRSGPNPTLRLLGMLLTMVAKRSLHQLYEEGLRSLYGASVFTSRIPEAVDYPEAVARRLPIAQYKGKSAAAKAVRALADEIVARVEAASPKTEAA